MCDFSSEKCILRSRNYKYRDVQLPDSVAVIIGRGPQTKIRDHRCSKSQIQIIADYKTRKAVVIQEGPNSSEIDGNTLHYEQSVEVSDGSSINLLKDDFKYTLEFVSSRKRGVPPASELITSKAAKSNEDNNHTSISSPHHDSVEKCKRESDCGSSVNKRVKHLEEATNVSISDDNSTQSIEAKLKAMRESLTVDMKSLSTDDKQEMVNQQHLSTHKRQQKLSQFVSTEDRWEEYDHSKLLIFTPSALKASSKIAAFDMDHTIITTKSGKVFPTSSDDWKIIYAEVPGKLKELHKNGYKIIIFTNQKGISRGKTYVHGFKNKVTDIVRRLGLPIQVFVSTGSGSYRKPHTGMWDYLASKANDDISVDMSESLYVGDAAGRVENWAPKKKKDFSCADRLFAINLGLKFFTPEEFFLGQKPGKFHLPNFDPRLIGKSPLALKCTSGVLGAVDENEIVSNSTEVILFVGFPAAGKTHFAETFLIPKGYVHVNRDTLGSWQKCVCECSKILASGRSVVVDNTNPDIESRSRFVECAHKHKVPCRCFLFLCTLEQAKHNNRFRELVGVDSKHVGVNDMVLNSYKSKYKEPTTNEGFTDILQINFVPRFKRKHDETLYKRFLLEK